MALLSARHALAILTGLILRAFAIMRATTLLIGHALAVLTTLILRAVLVTLAAGIIDTAPLNTALT